MTTVKYSRFLSVWKTNNMFQWKKNLPIFPHFLCCHLEQISHSTASWQGLTGAWHHIKLSLLILVMKHTTYERHFITRVCLDRAPVRPCQEAVECDICSRWQHRKCGNMGKFFFHWNISSNVQNLPYPTAFNCH
jgi:hypothetical protein